LDFKKAVPKVATDFCVQSTTVRDKCTRCISYADILIDADDFLNLLEQPEALRDHLGQKFPDHKPQITKRFSQLISEKNTSSANQFEKSPALKPANRVKKQEIIDGLVAYLKSQGGSAPKHEVEQALFELFKDTFQDPFYGECVGGGVPRWKKNVQFARNTARERGLIKGESERGVWELTEKG